MSLDQSTLAPIFERAQRLIEPVSGIAGRLRRHLAEAEAILDYTTGDQDGATATLEPAFVDGAVADEQTDALVWVAAVAAAQTSGRVDHQEVVCDVAPVSGDTDRLRAALMATCELLAATTWDDRMTFMDGGLATPMISIAQGVSVRDYDVASSLAARYRDIGITDVVGTYLDRLQAGQVAALPKQDTAHGYIDLIANSLAEDLTATQQQALNRMRDRPVIGGLLNAGEMIRPRPAVELARTQMKPAAEDRPLPYGLDAAYRRLQETAGIHVAYFKPTRLASRVIKMEYLEHDTTGYTTGKTLARILDAQTVGPRMKEPLGQHRVDEAAKRLVTANLSTITSMAARLMNDPAATAHYRT